MIDLSGFYIEWKPTVTEELAWKAILNVEDRKTNGMFCIVITEDDEDWFYSDGETSLDV